MLKQPSIVESKSGIFEPIRSMVIPVFVEMQVLMVAVVPHRAPAAGFDDHHVNLMYSAGSDTRSFSIRHCETIVDICFF